MFLTLDPGDKRAIYQQIADGIKFLIASGELVEGMPLPSVRQVAGDLGVNLNTIASNSTPSVFQQYAEIEFLLAEAALRGWGPGDAKTHY